MDKYRQLEEWSEGPIENLKRAWLTCQEMLIQDPKDVRALITACFIARRLQLLPQAYHFGRSCVELYPDEPIGWINLGHACAELWLVQEAEGYYQKGLTLSKTRQNQLAALLNLGAMYVDNGLFERGEAVTREILKIDPEHSKALANLAICQLARRDWSGWAGYHRLIGTPYRTKVQYRDEPEWDGTPGKTVVLYAEQGLGDEISFASMIPDAADVCRKVIFDCDGRLEHLFRRSFPHVTVYGTRIKEEKWAKEDWNFDCSLPVGQLGEFFRTTDESFPGTPYLKPCPIRRSMWREQWTKPAIGIAWTGGVSRTNARNRRITLEDLLPLLQLDAHFVCLQYKDAKADIDMFHVEHPNIDLTQYPWATLTDDYDDTAALVASLDYVVTIQTAVAHTAGALGVPVSVLVPTATSWRYGTHGDCIPWYRSMKVIRQSRDGDWRGEIERATQHVRAHLGQLPPGAGETPRHRTLRGGLHLVRPNGLADHREDGDHPSP